MTALSVKSKARTAKKYSAGKVIFFYLLTFCFTLILINSDAAIRHMKAGLELCAKTVIPSLFPFMIMSELLVSSGLGELFGKLFSSPMKKLFGLSGGGSSAAFLGSLCGFPIGAKTAISLYDKGVISKTETEHLMTFSNNPSSAFLINAVGISLFGNRRIGILIYFSVLLASFIIGFLARFFISGSTVSEASRIACKKEPSSPITLFTSSVSGATAGMLTVCAYVLFFSVISGCISDILESRFALPDTVSAITFGILEMSGGVSRASAVSNLTAAVILTSLISGWSGFSVHFQIISLCAGRDISFKPYFIAKAFQGLLSAIFVSIALILFPDIKCCTSDVTVESTLFYRESIPDIVNFVLLAVFLLGCYLHFIKGRVPRILS